VRQLFVICTILIQLLGYVSAEARPTAQTMMGTQKESPLTISSSFHGENPADITSLNHFASIAFKLRYQRALPAMTNWYNDITPVSVSSDKHSNVYSSPLFLPLIRLLLYPNHYFW
jgi:hypothetical protein